MVDATTPAEAEQTAVDGVPICLNASLAALIRLYIPRRMYLRLAAASGTEQIKEIAIPVLQRMDAPPTHILSPAEMEKDEE